MKYSVITAFWLYGTPLRRSQPPVWLVVVTFSEPQRWPGTALPPPRSRNASKAPPARCHSATDVPCSDRAPGADETGLGAAPGGGANRSSRVCWPASVSIFSVLSSCQLMRSRPGMRIRPPTP